MPGFIWYNHRNLFKTFVCRIIKIVELYVVHQIIAGLFYAYKHQFGCIYGLEIKERRVRS